jgi:hypothetical protein
MSEIPQVRRLSFNDEEIGMGFNSKTGQAVGIALQGFTIQPNPTASGAEVASSISIISTHEELQESLGMSFEAQGRYGLVSGSAKAQFAEKTNYNSMSTFVVASVVVQNPLQRGKNFRVTADARQLLDSLQVEEFERAFGDSFVRGLQTGGEFYAVVRITSVSMAAQSELSAALQAEYNGLVAAGSFKAKFEQMSSSSNTKSEFTSIMYQKAGAGATISPTVTIEEVIHRFKKFPEIAAASSSAYETEVATYDTIPLPIPTPTEQEAFTEALSDARTKKLLFIQIRNDLELALRFPEFFKDPPSAEILTTAASQYTKLMNAVTLHAIKLSKGQINPPQFFDPSALNPPLVEPVLIPLVKKNMEAQPALPNAMPNFVGRLAQPVVNLMACVQLENVDHCLSFLGSSIEAIGLDKRSLGDFFFETLRSGVQPNISGDVNRPGARIVAQSPSPGTPVEPLTTFTLQIG